MSDKRAYFYPVIAYTVVLLIVWLLSWVAGVVDVFVENDWRIYPLVSSEGVRWAVRNSLVSLNEVPWGTIIIVISIVGLLRGSGLKKALSRMLGPKQVTDNQKRAFMYAMIALLCTLLLLVVSIMSPWNLLLGVSGGVSGSPLVHGWLILFFFSVLFVSMAYGFIYGNYRSVMDVVYSLNGTFVYSIPGLMAIVPAAGIIPCIEYSGIFACFDMQAEEIAVFADIVYAIPFLYIILLHQIEKKEK